MDNNRLNTKAVSIGNIEFHNVHNSADQHFNHPKDCNKKYIFVYIEVGSVLYTFEDCGEFLLNQNSAIYIPIGFKYKYESLTDETKAFIITFEHLTGILPHDLLAPRQLFIPNQDAIFKSIINPTELSGTRDAYYFFRCSKLYELLWKSIHYSKSEDEASLAKKLQPAISAIESTITENLPVSYYASFCFICEVHFRRLFHKLMGCSPIVYRNRLRLEKADKMIRSGEYNVKEAAEAVGFNNTSFFCRAYKNYFGHTPLNNTKRSAIL